MSRADRRSTERARFVESHEALAGLTDTAFRAARRTGNDPVSLTTIATTVGGYRARVQTARAWLESHHPADGARYGAVVDRVESDVRPKLAKALTPDDRVGAARTASGDYDPEALTVRLVRAWGLVARNRRGPRRLIGWLARRRLDRMLGRRE